MIFIVIFRSSNLPGVQKNTHTSREARYFIKVLTKAPTGPYRQPDESSPHLQHIPLTERFRVLYGFHNKPW